MKSFPIKYFYHIQPLAFLAHMFYNNTGMSRLKRGSIPMRPSPIPAHGCRGPQLRLIPLAW